MRPLQANASEVTNDSSELVAGEPELVSIRMPCIEADSETDLDSVERHSTELEPFGSEPIQFQSNALIWFAAMLLLSVPMVTLIDVPIARWFASDPLPREIGNALELMRIFSHGSGIILILVGIFMMAPQSRWHLPRLTTLAVGAGAFATIGKMFVLRPRPTGLNLDGASIDSAWLWAFDWSLSQVAMFDASTRAFPSGNMATAMALTVGLWFVVPAGRWLFALICFGTLIQRLACGAHFPSDVLGGAAFGLLWAYACVHPKLLGNLFDKLQPESEPRRRRLSNDDAPPAIEQPSAIEQAPAFEPPLSDDRIAA